MKAVLFITAILLAANESHDIWVNLIGIGLMALFVVLFNHKKHTTMNEDFKVSDKSNDPDLNTLRIALSKLAVSGEMSEDGRKEIINYLNEL